MKKIKCNIYHPFIDDDNTLWGMDFGDNYDKGILKVSKDYGDTWTEVFDFGSVCDGITRPPIFGNIYITVSGYVFIGLKNKIGNAPGYLYRSTTSRIFNNFNLDFELVKTYDNGCFLNCWQFTEDEDGNLYTGLYNTNAVVQNHAFIYKSTDNGSSWTLIKNFDNSHVHSLYYNLYNKTLYATTGDNGKRTYISKDKGLTWIMITGNEMIEKELGGFTGMAFFEDSWLGGTDYYTDGNPEPSSNGYSNYITKTVGSGESQGYKKVLNLVKNPYNVAIFDMHSWGSDIAFAVTHDEWDATLTKCSSLWYTKDKGETWTLLDECKPGSKEPVYSGIAANRNSRIPKGFPYLIINNHWTRDTLYPREGYMTLNRYSINDDILYPNNEKKIVISRQKLGGFRNSI